MHCFCPSCLICALYFSPPLEIKLHFAAVAIPGRLDQGRAPLHGLSLPPVEASGTEGLGETSLRTRAWWPGVVVLSHILPRQFCPLILLILSPVNGAGWGRGEAKLVTVGDFGKGSWEGGFHCAMCPRVSHKCAHGEVGALRREFPGVVNGKLCPVECCEILYVLCWFWHSNRARNSASVTGLAETKGWGTQRVPEGCPTRAGQSEEVTRGC